jgi:hypothetical protein
VNGTLAAGIALVFALLVLWLVIAREVWRARQPVRLLLEGRHADAQQAAEQLERSWLRLFRGARHSARYAIACALHLRGELEASIAALAPLHGEKTRGDMRYAICSIDAANLVLLGRDHERARTLLEEAAHIHRPPEDILLAAHVSLALGQPDSAAQLFEAAGRSRAAHQGTRGQAWKALIAEDRRQQEAIFHTLRGLFLARTGRLAEAQHDLAIAAKNPIGSVYVERAREMLLTAASEADAPSSLAPQVVAKRTTSDRETRE